MHRLLKWDRAKAAAAARITPTSFCAMAHPNFRSSTQPFLPCHDRLVESWNSIKVSRFGITQVADQYLFSSHNELPWSCALADHARNQSSLLAFIMTLRIVKTCRSEEGA
jgi:hypothetical protein